jgi:hypothetical protein
VEVRINSKSGMPSLRGGGRDNTGNKPSVSHGYILLGCTVHTVVSTLGEGGGGLWEKILNWGRKGKRA